jgi:hypothetical protein
LAARQPNLAHQNFSNRDAVLRLNDHLQWTLWSIQQIELNMPTTILVGTRLGVNTGKIDNHRFARRRRVAPWRWR